MLVKINKPKLKDIIKSDITSYQDLLDLAHKIGIKDLKVKWLSEYDPTNPSPQILNLGSSSKDKAGTHWVCAYGDHYFDSFGMPPPPKLDHLQWTPLQYQDIDQGRCGQWCLFFIYHKKIDELDKFYSLFRNLNS